MEGILSVIIIGVIVLFIVWSQLKEQERIKAINLEKEQAVKKLKEETNFQESFSKKVGNYKISISETPALILIENVNKVQKIPPKMLRAENLIKVELSVNNNIVRQSGIGRAILGGVIAGGAGAVVGAVTAKQRQEINTVTMKFMLKDVQHPMFKLCLYNRYVNNGGVGHFILDNCEEIIASISVLLNENNVE